MDDPNWAAVEEAARTSPILQRMVTLARTSGNRERALIAAVLTFNRLHGEAQDRELQRVLNGIAGYDS